VKVTSKGQVTIPIEIRRKLGILAETEVEFSVSRDRVILRKARDSKRRGARLIDSMRGRATTKMSTDEIMALTRGE